MNVFFKDTSQVTEQTEYGFELPKYGPSTTDPTYYEPQATRIANMRKSASSMKTLYDFEGDELKKFADSESALKNIGKAQIDPRFNKSITREEISQITNDMGDKVQTIVDNKKAERKKATKELRDALTINKVIENTTRNNNTNEE